MQVAHVLALAMFVLSLFLVWNWHISCGFISFLPHFKGQSANRHGPFHHFINQKSCRFHSSESWMYEMSMKCLWNVYECMKCIWHVWIMDHHGVFLTSLPGSPLGLRQITGAEGERRLNRRWKCGNHWKPTWVGPPKIRQVWGTYLERDLMAHLLICWANSSQQANHHDNHDQI